MPISIEGQVGIIEIDSPPVNALARGVRAELVAGLQELSANPAIGAILIACAGRTFFAGADLAEFDEGMGEPDFRALMAQIEDSAKPVTVAIHGTALGGGLELALAAHQRIIASEAKIGLPEVTLGMIPGAGGTQRLTRLAGPIAALDLAGTGRVIDAAEAIALGIVDEMVPDDELRVAALAYAGKLVGTAPRRTRGLAIPAYDAQAFTVARDRLRDRPTPLLAGRAVAEAVTAAIELSFAEGSAKEWSLFEQLMLGDQSKALRHVFFAERKASRLTDISDGPSANAIWQVGVIGAGTMGGGIAMCFLNAGIPVMLVEARQDALDRGVATIRRNYEAAARKGRMTERQVEELMALLTPTLGFEELGTADLIVEAVFESMPLKKHIFSRLDMIAKPSAILASNTSFLDLNEIAASMTRPQQVIGLHFFSPANVMRLLEVVRGEHTSPQVIGTAMQLARTIGKVAVLSGVCHGFIANRAMDVRRRQAELLLLEGISAERIDGVLTDYGFAMGQFAMMDLVGLDVMGRDTEERTLMGDFVAKGRLGQKQGGGFFDYDDRRRPSPSPLAEKLIRDFASWRGVERREISDDDILARLLYPVVNEGTKILEERIASRASDIDTALVAGYGWPAHTGGPMYWGQAVGLDTIVHGLDRFAVAYGPDYEASPILRDAVLSRRNLYNSSSAKRA